MPELAISQTESVHTEDELILELAYAMERQKENLLQAKYTEFMLLSEKIYTLTGETKAKALEEHEDLYFYARDLRDEVNIHTAFLISQRLRYRNRELLAQIATARRKSDKKEFDKRFQELEDNLKQDEKAFNSEIPDLKSRSRALKEIEEALLFQKFTKQQVASFESSLSLVGKTLDGTDKVTEVLYHVDHLAESTDEFNFAGSFFSLLKIASALISARPKEMSTLSLSSLFFKVLSDTGALAKRIGPLAAIVGTTLTWAPIISVVAGSLNIAWLVSKIIITQIEYEQSIRSLIDYGNTKEGWLDPEVELTPKQKKYRQDLFATISIRQVCADSKIRSLFTQSEFKTEIMPQLIKHAAYMSKRELVFDNIALWATIIGLGLGIGILLTPGVGQFFAIGIAVVMIAAFVTKIVLMKTALKSQAGVITLPEPKDPTTIAVFGLAEATTEIAKALSQTLTPHLNAGISPDLTLPDLQANTPPEIDTAADLPKPAIP
ncbi:MAG: hypothetical protein KBD64_00850 [Gammaproteobacteria bacterium]|nr:hypothetical protein [Gammaproteobacteria bacterium]